MTVPSQGAKTFVLVHGASHGGWCYERVAAILRSQGHRVLTPTLEGCGERVKEMSPRTNLTTHINDILSLIGSEQLENLYLCGHSYGGMVITGVADKIPERIRNLVFIDSVVPETGKCMNDYVFPRWQRPMLRLAVRILGGGYKLTPPPPAWYFKVNKADQAMVTRRLTAHPFPSLEEKIVLAGNADRIVGHTYIYATKFDFRPLTEQYQNAKARKGWKTYEVAAGHDIMIDAPKELARILSSLD
ncbi:MAG: alpha/beta hydrolase [Hyphomonadaceae bacterium]|nr:alpha/beta hydrolase [Hyphomonadaceae bacterium]MCA8885137.1 alpha/beta hydrolase [Hyphomonadaceae bacterium]